VKLGILIPEFPTQTHIFFWREIEALRRLGVEVFLISTKRPTDPCPHAFAEEGGRQTHYVYPPRSSAVLQHLLRPAGLARAIRYAAGLSEPSGRRLVVASLALCAADLAEFCRTVRLDHIHVHSCADAAHIAVMARMMGGAPFSLHLHGDLEVYGGDHQHKFRNATFVSVAARSLGKQVTEKTGFPSARIHAMWMGVDTSRFQYAPVNARRDMPFHVVMVSRLNKAKGHAFVLEAIRKLQDEGVNVKLTIAGSGPFRPEIEASIKSLRLDQYVRLVGSLSERQVLELLREADVFVLSSIGQGEASPVAVMEAMAAGAPVISTVIGGTPDMIEHEINGLLVPQRDANAIAQAIRRLHNDEDLRRTLSHRARKYAIEHFDSGATARRFVSVIEDTIRVGQA
jgi:colanic acid/amylovoran biosynthesis glycosyltransferase